MRIKTKRKRAVLLFISVLCGAVLMWISMVRVVPEHMWKETIGTSRRDILGFGEESYSLKGPLVFHSEQLVGVILLYFPYRIIFLSFEDCFLAIGTYIPI